MKGKKTVEEGWERTHAKDCKRDWRDEWNSLEMDKNMHEKDGGRIRK